MRIELEDKAATGFKYIYDSDSDLVQVEMTRDGQTAVLAELTLEMADRWRTGRAKIYRESGFEEPVAVGTLLADDSDDVAWLGEIGIEVGE